MTAKERAAQLLRKTPRPDAIESANKVKAFREVHESCVKQFKGGKCTEQAAQSILNRLTPFF